MRYKASITRVIDGDTVEATIFDNPFFGVTSTTNQTLRLARIDAPENRGIEKEYGIEATKALRGMMKIVMDLPNSTIEVEANETDSFGRYIAEVWFKLKHDNDFTNISDWMVDCSHAEYREY